MPEVLLGSWGPQIVTYTQQYPWRVFAAVLVGILLIDMLLRQNRGTTGDAGIGGWDVGGDGDGAEAAVNRSRAQVTGLRL